MAEYAARIESIRSQTLQQIEQITASPKPTYEVDGQRVDWRGYLEALRGTVAWCDRQLADAQPYEVRSRGVSHA